MSETDVVRRFFAYVLMAVGGLITVLCGGCTLCVLGLDAWNAILALSKSPAHFIGSYALGALSVRLISLVVGGLPAAIGVALFFTGRRMSDERE